MDGDPFNDVREEVNEQLAQVRVKHKRWKEILKNPATKKNDAEFPTLHSELKDLAEAIGWNLNDLGETISIVQSNRSNFALSDEELSARKYFVSSSRSELEEVKKALQDPAARALMKKLDKAGLFAGREDPQSRLDREIEMDNDNFIQAQLTQRRELEEEQEVHLDNILKTVNTMEEIGHQMNDEIDRHNVMLGSLSEMADNTGSRIRKTMKDIDKFIDESNNTVSYTMIFILVLVVIGLFLAILKL
eukprot:CAMPEP_0201509672 /NCGR_PEP_ID=MMETSP0161_2-20130828/2655_1 /ASSEMBLY_ACC=CAM_ASM_000251 /TAXON_ID=180227 /ORGANISM="Neoparamoeba aestuarina, Strain SoJaBio B1-5/56/2" /LENGTH=246 /DNA_ID=CAMNT_0047904691 /DNA_START=262 /DNA_END=1002 /DNA_ORIENTATION=+